MIREVICIVRQKICKLITLLTATLALSLFLTLQSSASTVFISSDESDNIRDGVYNIVNTETGMYLDVYNTSYDAEGKAYLNKKSGSDGQSFLIRRQDDGAYIIYPQSENGKYALSCASDIMDGEFVTKTDKITAQNSFNIVKSEDGSESYILKPANSSDVRLAIGISSVKSKQKLNYVSMGVDTQGEGQQWQFIRESSEKISLSDQYFDLKVGASHRIYATLTPSYLIGNTEWTSADESIATVDMDGIVTGIAPGVTEITATCGASSVSCTVNVSPYAAYTWYSQHNNVSGGWNALPVSNITMKTVSGEAKKFFVYKYNDLLDWMDEGCKLCSVAMVLNNMGATLSAGYDMRTGQVNNLHPDPYTVALANTRTTGYDIGKTLLSNSPVLIYNENINSRFKVNGNGISCTVRYTGSLAYIKEQLELHPEGVVVGMDDFGRDIHHYVVFTECINPDAPDGKYEFRVCDSVAIDPQDGDNVPFTESYSYKKLGYRYSHITNVTVYNVG